MLVRLVSIASAAVLLVLLLAPSAHAGQHQSSWKRHDASRAVHVQRAAYSEYGRVRARGGHSRKAVRGRGSQRWVQGGYGPRRHVKGRHGPKVRLGRGYRMQPRPNRYENVVLRVDRDGRERRYDRDDREYEERDDRGRKYHKKGRGRGYHKPHHRARWGGPGKHLKSKYGKHKFFGRHGKHKCRPSPSKAKFKHGYGKGKWYGAHKCRGHKYWVGKKHRRGHKHARWHKRAQKHAYIWKAVKRYVYKYRARRWS